MKIKKIAKNSVLWNITFAGIMVGFFAYAIFNLWLDSALLAGLFTLMFVGNAYGWAGMV